MVDNRRQNFAYSQPVIQRLCDRRFGIGADGLIALEVNANNRFRMRYFNADGREGSMCGNGGRSFVRFLYNMNLIPNNWVEFDAIDGVHSAEVDDEKVSLHMQDVAQISRIDDRHFADTGSPHVVLFCDDVAKEDVAKKGHDIRQHTDYAGIGGTNVNFVQAISDAKLAVRTFERGVEAETLSCGTGVVASALIYASEHAERLSKIEIQTAGGELQVEFAKDGNSFTNIILSGPAEEVFKGTINIIFQENS